MKSITIHDMDDSLAVAIRKRAEKDGVSLNKAIKRLLAIAIGMQGKKPAKKADFSKFCGIWSSDDAREFSAATKDFERINEADWK